MTAAAQRAVVRSKAAERLFGAGGAVIVEEAPLIVEPALVHPDEARQVEGAVLRRRVEFSTGRWCARRALGRLGVGGFVLCNGPDRAPRWPAGIVGSITHTGTGVEGYCGVAVARASQVRAIGLDAEGGSPLDPSLWPSILTPAERERLAAPAVRDPGTWAKVIFSAKESFYKAQFPLSGRYLDFRDVEVTIHPSTNRFFARIVGDAGRDLPLSSCEGRYLLFPDLVVTGIALAA